MRTHSRVATKDFRVRRPFARGLLGMVALTAAAIPIEARAQAAECNGVINIAIDGPACAIPTSEGGSAAESRYMVTVGLGAGTILPPGPGQVAGFITVNRFRYNLDCQIAGSIDVCTNDGDAVSFIGVTDNRCGGVTFTCAPDGGNPNQLICTPDITLQLLAGAVPTNCEVDLLVQVDNRSLDASPDLITAAIGASQVASPVDWSCSNSAPGAFPAQTLSIGICETCEVSVEKKCCIPAPPPPPFTCDNPIDELTMIWDGGQDIRIKAFKGATDKALLADIDGIMPGNEVTVTGFAGSPNDVFWEIFIAGTSTKIGESTFHLSCSDDDMDGSDDCGKREGDGKDKSGFINDWILEGMVDAGGVLDCTAGDPDGTRCVDVPPLAGDDCQGKVVSAVFEYTGAGCTATTNFQEGKVECSPEPDGADGAEPARIVAGNSKRSRTWGSAEVVVGGTLELNASNGGRSTLESNTFFDITDPVTGAPLETLEIHTSCSKPLNVGDRFGSLRLVTLTTTEGGTRSLEPTSSAEPADECEIPAAPPPPHCTTKINALTLRYLGGDCNETTNRQGRSNLEDLCSGGDPGPGPVFITILKDEDKVSASPSGEIGVDDLVVFTHVDGELKGDTEFQASGAGETQRLKIHTSCSRPVNLGDRFGAFEVFAIDRKDQGRVALGGEVEYQYTVTNPSETSAVEIVELVDSELGDLLPELGDLLPELTLGPGESSPTLYVVATILEDTTNVVEVTAQLGGQQCMNNDSVLVTVVPPPPALFTCAKPIDALTMIWDGMQDIHVKAYKGDAEKELLADIDGIMPRDEVTVTGFAGSPNDVIWEIFAAGTSTKLGESTFHLSCSDADMNGPEDCGRPQGDGKDKSGFINDWILEGMVDAVGVLDCTP